MKTNFKVIAVCVLGCAAGCIVGFLLPSKVTFTAESGKGDIGKVSKFSKNVVSPSMSAFQEKITSNPEELKKATVSLTVLTSRMAEFDELVTMATLVSESNDCLASSVKALQDVKQLASNARTNGIQALNALEAISQGEKSSVDYEQASQNLSLAFLMVDRQMNVGKQYVSDVDAFLRGKDVRDYSDLAFVRDLWAGYCAGEAVLNGDSKEQEYWSKKENQLSSGNATLALGNNGAFDKYDFSQIKECIAVDAALGLAEGGSEVLKNGTSRNFIMNNEAQRIVIGNSMAMFLSNQDDFEFVKNNEAAGILKGSEGLEVLKSTEGAVTFSNSITGSAFFSNAETFGRVLKQASEIGREMSSVDLMGNFMTSQQFVK